MNQAATPANPFIRALALSRFSEFATAQGLRASDLLRHASLPADIEQRPETLLAYRRYCTLLDLCARHSENPLFGLLFGLHQGLAVFGDLLYLICNANTLGEALLELRDNYAVNNGALVMSYTEAEDEATLAFSAADAPWPGHCQAEELVCAVLLKLLRAVTSADWHPVRLMIAHPALAPEADYRAALGLSPVFSATCSGLVLPRSLLSLPLSTTDTMLHRMLTAHIGRMERLAPAELPACIEQLLRHLLPGGRATLDKAASWMAVNPRTLQRRLEQEGTSFQKVLDKTRQALAREYLNDPAISMGRLADLLGYADPSGFSRAFQRWFGTTPLHWQRQYGPARQPRLLRGRKVHDPT
ncbi:AraC family transcriptional regulator [Pseudomonas sp. zfem002]|uniref:AraC family transcriptional regulator n=1 Tax=Pseudomonas sp. zfem002 TaxID=3078197 RepID=UPI0029297405|nr:AraC family transcriptional regulator ligand-binding domain-containing protein [Pseudomonas sp. zfem002]MDU9393939.1 AraC family transcriptional regulator ligand-binding domain-containing protein [Pseudomonas sp. zfem002]